VSFTKAADGATGSDRKGAVISTSGTKGTSNTFAFAVDGNVVGKKLLAALCRHTHNYTEGLHTLSAWVKDTNENTGSTTELVMLF
jgi:hypothetical protein